MMAAPAHRRVLIPPGYWTAVDNYVIDKVLRTLKQKSAVTVFMVIYNRARHRPRHRVDANLSDLARWTGLDTRTVKECLRELRQKGLIVKVKRGVHRSRNSKPRWRVPLCEFPLSRGNWTPVPRFLFTKYLPAYPNSVLLMFLLHIQHFKWLNHCWPGAKKLAERMGWSESRVDEALKMMVDKKLWRDLGTGLPRPLKVVPSKDVYRHYRVRLVWYNPQGPKRGRIRVSRPFRKRFNVPLLKP